MQQESINTTRILALHVRPQRFGFAVFKGPKQLLDWGGSGYVSRNGQLSSRVSKRIDPLLTIYAPSVVVVRKATNREQRQYGDLGHIVSIVQEKAARHSAEFVSVGREEVRRAFEGSGNATKDRIAAQVAVFFPELMWKLPPPRKSWQKEHHNMAIFDAAALGITYFSRFGEFGLRHRDVPDGFQRAV